MQTEAPYSVQQQHRQADFHAPAVQQEHYPTDTSSLLFNEAMFNQMEKMARVMASGKTTVPQHLQGNVGDCMAIIMQAAQWRMNPVAVAQKTHLVNGTLGYEAQLVNAVVTSMAPIEGRLKFEFFGDWKQVIGKFRIETSQKGNQYAKPDWKPADEEGLGVIVSATLKGEREPRTLELLMKQCWPRQSTNWAYDPQQQIIYSGIKKWARRYCPDVILGVYTPDEIGGEVDITNRGEVVRDGDDLMPKSKPAAQQGGQKQQSAPETTERQQTSRTQPQQSQPVQQVQGEMLVNEPKLAILRRAMDSHGINEQDVCDTFGIQRLEDLPASRMNDALKLIKGE